MLGGLRRRRLVTPSVGRLVTAVSLDAVVLTAVGAGSLRAVGLRYDDGLPPVTDDDPMPESHREMRAWIEERRRQGEPPAYRRRDGTRVPGSDAIPKAGGVLAVLALGAADLLAGGWTPGRRLAGVALVQANGRPPTPEQAFVRDLVPALMTSALQVGSRLVLKNARRTVALRVVIGAGFFVAGVRDPAHRSLGDRLAGTRLVVVRGRGR